jgi:hypothetical protein
VQDIHQLSFVLVNPLHLHAKYKNYFLGYKTSSLYCTGSRLCLDIEQAVGVDLNARLLEDEGGQLVLVLLLHTDQFSRQ